MQPDEKPNLVLMRGHAEFEQLLSLFERVAGRPATPEEVEEARAEFEADEQA